MLSIFNKFLYKLRTLALKNPKGFIYSIKYTYLKQNARLKDKKNDELYSTIHGVKNQEQKCLLHKTKGL